MKNPVKFTINITAGLLVYIYLRAFSPLCVSIQINISEEYNVAGHIKLTGYYNIRYCNTQCTGKQFEGLQFAEICGGNTVFSLNVCWIYLGCAEWRSLKISRIMDELPWITIFGSRVRWFANNFHDRRSHKWTSLANRFTSDPEIVIRGKECIILFLTHYFMSWTHNCP